MLDPVSGAMSAAGDMGSAVISGLFGAHSAKKSMKFQEQMSNTAYQRAAVDLEKAGLNRILALGNPASTPPGATATMPDAKVGSSFQAGSSAKAQRNVMDVQKHLMNEQADAATTSATKNIADTAVSEENVRTQETQQTLNLANAKAAAAQAIAAIAGSRVSDAAADKTETTNILFPLIKELGEDPIQFIKNMGKDFSDLWNKHGPGGNADKPRPSNAKKVNQ